MAIQFSLSTGSGPYTVGNYDDGVDGTILYLTDSVGGASYAWSFVSAPRGSSASLNNAGTSEANFTPDMTGTWIVKLVLDGNTEQRYLAVKTDNYEGRLPGREETEEDATYGWAEDLNDLLRSIDAKSMQPVYQKVTAGEILTEGDIVSIHANSLAGGFPKVLKTDATYASFNDRRRPVGMVIETILTGEVGNIIVSGLYEGNTSSFSGNGVPLYVDLSTGGLTETQGEYPIGMVLLANASGTIWFDFGGLGLRICEAFIPIEWGEDGTAPPALAEILTDGVGKIRVRKFDDASDEDIVIPWEIPYHMLTKYGVRMTVVGFLTESTMPGAGTTAVQFDIAEYQIDSADQLGGTFGTAKTSSYSFTTFGWSQYDRWLSDEVLVDSLDTNANGELCMFKLSRNTSVANNYTQDIGVYGLKIKWLERR